MHCVGCLAMFGDAWRRYLRSFLFVFRAHFLIDLHVVCVIFFCPHKNNTAQHQEVNAIGPTGSMLTMLYTRACSPRKGCGCAMRHACIKVSEHPPRQPFPFLWNSPSHFSFCGTLPAIFCGTLRTISLFCELSFLAHRMSQVEAE